MKFKTSYKIFMKIATSMLKLFEAIQFNSIWLEQYKLCFHTISALIANKTNPNFGVNESLLKNIRVLVPNFIKENCHTYTAHNRVKHALKFLSYDIENVILKMYTHVSHSTVRKDEFKRLVASESLFRLFSWNIREQDGSLFCHSLIHYY